MPAQARSPSPGLRRSKQDAVQAFGIAEGTVEKASRTFREEEGEPEGWPHVWSLHVRGSKRVYHVPKPVGASTGRDLFSAIQGAPGGTLPWSVSAGDFIVTYLDSSEATQVVRSTTDLGALTAPLWLSRVF